MSEDLLVVATGDVHIDHGRHGWVNPETGRNTAWESTRDRWLTICQWAVEHDADVVLIGGDLFLDGRPSAEGMAMAAEGFHLLRDANIPSVLLLGNHELIRVKAQHRHALLRFADIPGVTVIDSPDLIEVAGIQIAGLPWPRRGEVVSEMDLADLSPREQDDMVASALVNVIDDIADDVDPTAPSLVLAHAAVGEAKIGTDKRGSELTLRAVFNEPVVPLDALDRDPFGHVVLSHVHQRQFLSDRAHYVGSPDRIDFSEEREAKGFSVLRSDGHDWKVELVETGARQMRTFRLDEEDFDPDVLTEGMLVRVFLPEGETKLDPAVRAGVAGAGARLVKVVSRPKAVVRAEKAGLDGSLEGIGPIEGVEIWADLAGLDEPTKNRLVKKASEVVNADAAF